MIKYFRRIRQKLLTDARLSKYLIYAIGEIALVMIGILLALQVNTWNQDRLNQVKMAGLLSQLQNDIEADIFLLNENNKIVDTKERFLTSIVSTSPITIEYINEEFTGGTFNLFMSRMQGPPNIRDYTYKEMMSTGTLSLIENAVLKENIQDYYRFVENRTYALNQTFSEWPRVLSEHIPAEGSIHADHPSPLKGYPPDEIEEVLTACLLYTSPSPRD